jgi:hypothetical protein
MWQWVERGGRMDIIAGQIKSHELAYPGSLPDLRACAKLCACVDWGGQDSRAEFSSLAILLVDEHGCEGWYGLREQLRREYLPDGRRLSYKDLSDRVCQQALPSFLVAADAIPGLLFTVLVDRKIQTLTGEPLPPKVDFADAIFGRDDYRRLELTAQFLGFLLAGLSGPGQPGQLILDEDAIVANQSQKTAVCTALALVMNDLLPHKLGGWTVSDAACARDRLLVEGLLALPDLAAGALSELASRDSRIRSGASEGSTPPGDPSLLKPKTRATLHWLGVGQQPLKRLALVIRGDGDSERSVIAQLLGLETPAPHPGGASAGGS